ncbi:membrane protein insertase YidC [Mucilaginibacter sp. X5P1]|uniref:membrane protein insertase YidC n=1 Tax=Mucilaginibacter sp. X5P1 TaxID=2723088 RepID=UPI0016194472|nr:membrane protein insertase YidC [Mucilaginibacter sp. X5P1]MBB6138148.1 YidC/Oxa1 family membrane protein insertase [Mucilaginibacter sp. X5P1]
MDRNSFTGLFLIMLIIFGSFYLLKPKPEEIKREKERQHIDSLKKAGKLAPQAAAAKADTSKVAVKLDSAQLKGAFGPALAGTEKFITLENKDLRLKLTTHGGRIYSVELKNFKTFDGKPLILFDGTQNSFGINLAAENKTFDTNNLYFSSPTSGLTVADKDSGSITLRLNYSATQYIDYIYTLNGTGYKVGFTIKPTGLDNVVANSNTLNINWTTYLKKQEKDMELERRYSTVYYKTLDDNVDYLSENKDDQKDITDGKAQWVSFKGHFFSDVILANNGFAKTNISVAIDTSDHVNTKQMKADLQLAKSSDGTFPMSFYFEPNQFHMLQAEGYSLEKQINLGPGPLKYINRFATLPVFDFLKQFNWNYGLIILALTVILKLVLSPLTYKSYLSMAKMRVLKPEMDEIKAKVGEDNPTLLQQEYLKLYKKAGVNPLGGCLPLLIQMPIVFAFFRFFPSLFELRGQSFLWMHDLSTYDAVITFTRIPVIGIDHLSLMCLLMTISTLIYTYFNNQISGATGQMKYIGYITPVIFLVTLNSYPAGLNYYYFLANMLTFLQQYLIRFMVDDKKIHAQIQENKKKPEDTKKKKSGFQARMEDMMKQKQLDTAKKK